MVKPQRAGFRARLRNSAPVLTAALLACLMAIEPPSSIAEHQLPAPITARELVGMHGLSDMTISPDGKFVAVQQEREDVISNTTVLDWLIVPMQGGPAVRAASGGAARFFGNGGRTSERAQWSPDGRWIYYTALNGEEVQVWRARVDGKKAEQVTHDAADIIAFEVSADGSVVYAAAGATRAEIKQAERQAYDDGVLIDKTVIPNFPLIRSFPYNGRMATLRVPKPNSVFKMTLLGDRPVRFMKQVPGAAKAQPAPAGASDRYESSWVTGSARYGNWGAGRFRPATNAWDSEGGDVVAPGGDKIARVSRSEGFASGNGSNHSGQDLVWRRGGGPQTACRQPACTEPEGLALLGWLPNGSGIVFQSITQGHEAIRVWNINTDDIQTLAELEGSFGAISSGRWGVCELGHEAVACVAAAPDMPPRLVAIDLRTGKQTLLLDPNPSLAPSRLARSETILLRDKIGSVTWARLLVPRDWSPAKGRLPLVITSYSCGGFLLGGSGDDVPEQVFAGRGYAALCVSSEAWNVRRPAGFTNYGVDQSTLEFNEDAVRALDARGLIDPTRVAVAGFSGTSGSVAYSLPRSETFTAAIVTTDTGGDPIVCYLNAQTGNCRRHSKALGDKPPYDGRNSHTKDSAALNAGSIVTPLMMQLSDVEYPNIMQLYGALGDYDRAFELRVYPDEYHIKRQPRHRLNVYERNVEWVEFWLRGQEASAPELRPQYERWRAMRDGQCKMFAARPTGAKTPWYCNQPDPKL